MTFSTLKRHGEARRGFTLIETALATIIVGVGVVAIVSAQQAFHIKNNWSTHASTATLLGNEIREMTLNLPRHDPVTGLIYDPNTGDLIGGWGWEANETSVEDLDDIDDFDGDGAGLIFSAALGNGPVNAQRQVILNMPGWTQTVYVDNVDPFDITSLQDDGTTNMLRVEVIVTYQAPSDSTPREMTRVSWITPN
ncbi:MAG: prepilin-type N-terminal cleavage/methylation domain-containing protein [Planctomycetes bacterium]|nr:prepilin-type N-terminal cleavage/methylation domain-containing protein [Planctomycetota bacterium]MCH8210286.1 prepilin-type N-terminal cleavage/methylation domain-containing protein [Planctomycetota bacterium]